MGAGGLLGLKAAGRWSPALEPGGVAFRGQLDLVLLAQELNE